MTPIYRTSNMEASVNLMAKYIRNVMVDATQWVRPNVKIRPNLIDTASVYFDRRPSNQFVLWRNNGGVLIRKMRENEYDNDAIFFQECPRSIEILDRACRLTQHFAVIYEPPTWRVFFEMVEKRFSSRSEKQRYIANVNLERVRQLLEASPRFTAGVLEKILLVHSGRIPRPSSVRESLSDEARSPDIRHGAA